MSKLSVLLVYGGESSEHDVSVKSAHNVYAALDNEKYDVTLCYIDQSGKWWLTRSINGSHAGQPQLFPALGQRQFVAIPGNRPIHVDVVLPILHGKNGEDGTVQGLLELMKTPYVGCGVEASALCMDKIRTKALLQKHGIKVTPSNSFSCHDNIEALIGDYRKGDQYTSWDELGDGPWFVKPSRAGSSVGVTKVYDPQKLVAACREAFKHDDEVLIEKAIDNIHEIEVAVLGNYPDISASSPGEIVPGEEFYSYDDKYSSSSSSIAKFELPENIRALSDVIRNRAIHIYKILGCRGLARVDFFVTDGMEIYVNEINTMPGFTNISMYPKLWHEQGLRYPQLIDRLIALALEK